MIAATRARRARFLGRLPATVRPLVVRTLADGTQLVRLRPGEYQRRRRGDTVLVRLIRYTLDDPPRPGHGAEHRLVTSLLNPRRAPAEELVLAYHSRWEFELAADEVVLSGYTPESPRPDTDLNMTRIGASELTSEGNRRYPFNGSIDEVMVFDRALSADEVRAIFQNFATYKP